MMNQQNGVGFLAAEEAEEEERAALGEEMESMVWFDSVWFGLVWLGLEGRIPLAEFRQAAVSPSQQLFFSWRGAAKGRESLHSQAPSLLPAYPNYPWSLCL